MPFLTQTLKPLLLALALTACSSSESLLPLPQTSSDLSLTSRYKTVELLEIELPNYAEQDDVALQTSDGLIVTQPDLIWADSPKRSTTLQVAQHLEDILKGTTVASEPWPYSRAVDRIVSVKIERYIAGENGEFYLDGRFTVGNDLSAQSVSSHKVSITTPWSPPNTASLAKASALALKRLAEQIAQTLAR